mmetsp:Transcript_26774/g.68833  ORF Transcript_26774/g.68833 Transcript_26774/m.68833 type:complete len:272 (+) Transcript_26774:723-1538(+)
MLITTSVIGKEPRFFDMSFLTAPKPIFILPCMLLSKSPPFDDASSIPNIREGAVKEMIFCADFIASFARWLIVSPPPSLLFPSPPVLPPPGGDLLSFFRFKPTRSALSISCTSCAEEEEEEEEVEAEEAVLKRRKRARRSLSSSFPTLSSLSISSAVRRLLLEVRFSPASNRATSALCRSCICLSSMVLRREEAILMWLSSSLFFSVNSGSFCTVDISPFMLSSTAPSAVCLPSTSAISCLYSASCLSTCSATTGKSSAAFSLQKVSVGSR